MDSVCADCSSADIVSCSHRRSVDVTRATAVRSLSQKRRRAAMAAAAASVTVLAAASSAHAARSPTLPPRVAALLDHLKNHPMTVTSQCMQYDAEPSTPLPDVARSLTPDDCRIAPGSRSRHADCIAGALLAAVGGLDAAHNIVTPLSWRSFTPYAGKPVACSPMEAADASYVHALIHRQEGSADGEFGSGFSNANFWHRTAAGAHASQSPCQAARVFRHAVWTAAVTAVHPEHDFRGFDQGASSLPPLLRLLRRGARLSRRRAEGPAPGECKEAGGRLGGQAPGGARGGSRPDVDRLALCRAVRAGGARWRRGAAALLRGCDGGGAAAVR